jgi:uncharacterized membrane protein YfcA
MAVAALALGGIIKGATGAGAPIVAVPVMAMTFGVEIAVVTFTVPSLIMNLMQGWQFRAHALPPLFTWSYALAGAAGAIIGTWLLATVTPELLLLAVAGVVLVYIAFRLSVPGWGLSFAAAARLVAPVGVVAGILQGATGVSAPVSITFLNAMRLERPVFIATISIFFVMMSAVQVPALVWLGLMDWTRFGYALAALVPLLAFMPVGNYLARHVSRQVFDRVILGLLAIVSVRLIWIAAV